MFYTNIKAVLTVNEVRHREKIVVLELEANFGEMGGKL